MERYSGTQAMEGAPVSEWTSPGGDTGLEGEYTLTCISISDQLVSVRIMWTVFESYIIYG